MTFQNPSVFADVSVLTVGIDGAVVLSVFSTALEVSGFLVERSLPATAVIFTEPEIPAPQRRQESPKTPQSTQESCPRPKIPIGKAITKVHEGFSPILNKIPEPIKKIHSNVGMLKTKMLDFLGLQCLFPRLIKPFSPLLKYVRCLIGLNFDDGFMTVPSCEEMICSTQETEEREITHRLEIPHMETAVLSIRTMDSCFHGMKRIDYGTRILVTLVDDQPCDNPRFLDECKELMEQDRVVTEDECETPG